MRRSSSWAREIKLISVKLDGKALAPSDYVLTDSDLTIPNVPAAPFTLEIETECDPVGNTASFPASINQTASSARNARRKASGASPISTTGPM